MTAPRPRVRCACPGLVWAVTDQGRRQPLNGQPDPEGNVAAYRDHTGTWRCRTLGKGEQRASHEKVYMPHHATCPELARVEAEMRAAAERQRARETGQDGLVPAGVADLVAYRARRGRR